MQTQVTQTNTTGAVSLLSHADIVRVLGLAVAVDAGLRIDAPGTTITAELASAEADGEFTAAVSVLIDHNYVAPEPEHAASDTPADPSLNSAVAQPVVTGAAAPPALPVLQIPGAPPAAKG